MQIVILCGGLATRLKHLAKKKAKSMIDINGKPFLEYQIKNVKKYDIKDIVLCVGHLSEQIIDYFGNGENFGVNIRYSHDGEKPLGPIGALKKAENLLKKDFFIMYGDSYLSVNFKDVYNFYKKYDKPACMVIYKNLDKYDESNLIIKDNLVLSYGYKERTKDMVYIDYGTSLLDKKTLNTLKEDTYYSTGDFFSGLIKNHELLAYEVKSRFYHIGNLEALQEFREYIKTQGV